MKAHRTIHLFRYGATGLYALTDDPSGHSLPIKVCPFGWHFEKSIGIEAGNRARFKPALAEISKHKVYLTHAAFAGSAFDLPGSADVAGGAGPRLEGERGVAGVGQLHLHRALGAGAEVRPR